MSETTVVLESFSNPGSLEAGYSSREWAARTSRALLQMGRTAGDLICFLREEKAEAHEQVNWPALVARHLAKLASRADQRMRVDLRAAVEPNHACVLGNSRSLAHVLDILLDALIALSPTNSGRAVALLYEEIAGDTQFLVLELDCLRPGFCKKAGKSIVEEFGLLGLPIAFGRYVASRFGGDLTGTRAEADGGVAFRLRLPVCSSKLNSKFERLEGSPAAPPATMQASTERVESLQPV
jgi:hypothetical protein